MDVKILQLGNQQISLSKAKQLLQNPSEISYLPAIKPSAGSAYFFKGASWESRNDFRCDQYRFISDGRNKNTKLGITRRYYKIKVAGGEKHEMSAVFQRHVFTLTPQKLDEAPVCLVHYFGDEKQHTDTVHGNSKKKTGIYLPSLKSVIKKIAAEAETQKPKKVYDKLQTEKSREKEQLRMPVDRPRDIKQCENMQYAMSLKKKFSNDEYFGAVEVAIQTHGFVRQLTVYPDLVIHLATEALVNEMKSLVKLSGSNCDLEQVVSYDTTFCLGNFYLSVVVARNTKMQGNPIFPVAFMIHERKFLKHHREFLRDIFPAIGLTRSQHIPVVTDREKGMTKCLKTHFPRLKNVFCTNHILKDVEMWIKKHGGVKDDLKVLKDDVARLIDCPLKEEFDSVYVVLSSNWTSAFKKYFEQHLLHDLVHHTCKFVTKQFSAFSQGAVTNNIAESMNHVLKAITAHQQFPVDLMIMVLKQVQEIYHYDFLRAVTGFGRYQLKKEFSHLQQPLTEVNLPVISTMETLVQEVLSKESGPLGKIEKGENYRLTQRAMARLCIQRNCIGFSSATSSFSVINPFGKDIHSVRLFPKPSTCSCCSTGLCFHILAVRMAVHEPVGDTTKDKRSYSLSMMIRKSRGTERKSGQKRPRPKDYDYDVEPASDANFPLSRNLLKAFATSTPRKADETKFSLDQSEIKDFNESMEVNETTIVDEYPMVETEDNVLQHSAEVRLHPWLDVIPDYGEKATNKQHLLHCLESTNWLSDQTVEHAINCVLTYEKTLETYLLFDSFFTSCAQRNMYEIIASFACNNEAINFDNFVFLCNPGSHWFIIVANLNKKTLSSIDTCEEVSSTKLESFMRSALQIINASYAIAGVEIDTKEWQFIQCQNVPQQQNSYDCGVLSVVNTFCIVNRLPLVANVPSTMARKWIGHIIAEIELPDIERKPASKLCEAKERAKKAWSKVNLLMPVPVEKRYYKELFSPQGRPSTALAWDQCEALQCTGYKHNQTQVFCISCRKWFHQVCLPGSVRFDGTYFNCSSRK